MGIMLYDHNKKAYDSAIAMLKSVGKAAVIHPTGTGKSFIGFKLCEDNPDKRICWLSPSKYIFSTQIENMKAECQISEEAKDNFLSNISFLTYARLMNMTEEEMQEIKPDYIILDEFHRCGAVEWGRGVERFLSIHENVPILGLSATAIRYLDNQRDMSDELFDGHVASEISLGEAIVRGILNPPKYVLSIFSYKEELGRYETRVKLTRNKAVRDKAEEKLELLRRALDKAEGLDEVFNKHMTDRTGKYIVFCANFEAMQEAKEKISEWFHLVDENPHVYTVYSDDPTSSKSFKAFKADDDTTHLRLIFCIDVLNEGVHVDDVSGVILLRPTVSPIIYKQQIGRALSASKKTEPVVFDIVNNIKNLYSIDAVKDEMKTAIEYFANGDNMAPIVNDKFELITELSNCLELFNELEDTLSASWDIMYLEAKRYYEQYGNLLVPADYMTEAGYGLGRWIRTQRIARQNRDSGSEENYSPITDEHIEKLDEIGMIWSSVLKEKWLTNYRCAEGYYQVNGNLVVPHDYVVTKKYANGTTEDIRLGVWITSQRTSYIKGKLSQEQIDLLEKIGMSWIRYDEKWETGFSYARKYYEEQGDINFVPKSFEYDGFNLLKWLNNQRTRYKDGKLTDIRIKRLEELGFKFSINEAFWDMGYEHACEYKNRHGDMNIPAGYVCDDGFKLKAWIANQKTRAKRGTLSMIQITKLQQIGGING